MGKLVLEDLKDFVWAATHHDYLLGILVTSQAQAKIKSEGWSFGAGKSTFGLSYFKQYVWGGNFDKAMEHMIGFPHELAPFLKPPTTPGVFCDDIQLWAGKHKAHDNDVRELAYFLTTQRPHINVIIATCPHRGMLQKDFREELFSFEIIVPKRGVFEVQRLKRNIPFYNPLDVSERLRYFGEGPFLDLSSAEKKRYLEWRQWRDEEAKQTIKLLQDPTHKKGEAKQTILRRELRERGYRFANGDFNEAWQASRRQQP